MPIEPTVHRIETPSSGRLLVRAPASGIAAGVLAGFHGYAESADAHFNRLTAITGIANWLVLSVQGLNRFYRGRSQETVAGWMTRQDREIAIALNIVYVDRALDWVRREFSLHFGD